MELADSLCLLLLEVLHEVNFFKITTSGSNQRDFFRLFPGVNALPSHLIPSAFSASTPGPLPNHLQECLFGRISSSR